MVLIYTSACTTGLCFHATGLTPEQEAEVRRHVAAYEKPSAWRARGNDGGATVREDEDAVREHNRDNPEEPVDNVAGLLAFYAESGDGHGEAVSPERLVEVARLGGFRALGYEG